MKKILSILLATALILTGTLAMDFAATKYKIKKVAEVYGVYIAPDLYYAKITLTEKNITIQRRVLGEYEFSPVEKALGFSNCNYFKVSSMKIAKDKTSVNIKFNHMKCPQGFTIIKTGKDSYSLETTEENYVMSKTYRNTVKLIKFIDSKAADAYMKKDKSLASVIAKEAPLAKEIKFLNDTNKAKNSKLTSEGYFYNDYNDIFGEFQVEVPNEAAVGKIKISVNRGIAESTSVRGEYLFPENDYTVGIIKFVNDSGSIGYNFSSESVKFTKVDNGLEITYIGTLSNRRDGKIISETASLTFVLSDPDTIQSIACSENIDVLNVSNKFTRKALSYYYEFIVF